MPTRYLKPGIRDSDRINGVSNPDAEILYYRLLVTVDDFGRYDARPEMIKAACFPIRTRATADKCAQWVQELEIQQLLFTYGVGGKLYLQLTKWENKARSHMSKYPECIQMRADCPQMLPGTGTGTEVPSINLKVPIVGKSKINGVETRRVLDFLNTTAGKRFRPSKTNLDFIRCRLEDGISEDDLRKIVVRKSREWLPDPKMRGYLRPATLFNRTQCEQYLGELVPPNMEKTTL